MPPYLFYALLVAHLFPILFQILAVAKKWKGNSIFEVAVLAFVFEVVIMALSVVIGFKMASMQGAKCATPYLYSTYLFYPVVAILILTMAIQYLVQYLRTRTKPSAASTPPNGRPPSQSPA